MTDYETQIYKDGDTKEDFEEWIRLFQDLTQSKNRVNELGIYKLTDLSYIVPILPENVEKIVGYKYKNILTLSEKFDCNITFRGVDASIYDYPIVLITSDEEIKLWECINHIQKKVSRKQTVKCLYSNKCDDKCKTKCYRYSKLKHRVMNDRTYSQEFSKRKCYCEDSSQDTFDECSRCLELNYILKIEGEYYD